MRILAIAAAALALTAGAAFAQPWADPQGRLTFNAPNGWPIDVQAASTAELLHVITGTADDECQFVVFTRAQTATATANAVRIGMQNPIGEPAWLGITQTMTRMFRSPATVQNPRVDTTSGFWPIQRAELVSGDRTVHGAMQARPGLEIWTLCLTYTDTDRAAQFTQVINSVGAGRDAEWRAEIEAAQAPAAPAEAPN
ncbi:MAG: hypothetical protein AB7J28_04735 [Hyphomonadaceae bacterium]